MLRSSGRTAAAFLTAALATAACASERAAPVVTRPPPPSTTTTTPATTTTTTSTTTSSAPTTVRTGRSTTTTVPPPTTAAGVDSVAWLRFDDALASRMLGSGDYAVSVAVAVDGRLVHTGAFGFRVPPPPPPPRSPRRGGGTSEGATTTVPWKTTVGGQRPDGVEPTDRFRVASISKTITAAVVLQLVEAGELTLDQPVGELLADHVDVGISDPAVAGVTVRGLLSHTAGVPSYYEMFFDGDADSCPTVARAGLSGRLDAPPGAKYDYSNLNYCLLGLLIERVTGRPYEHVVREQLLEPLGITGMRLAATFDPHPAEVLHPSIPLRNYMEVLGPAGAWVGTPADLVKIVDALDPVKPGWHPLSDRTLELMRKPIRRAVYQRPEERWYGLGLIVFADGSWGHTGTLENAHSIVLCRPDGVTFSVLVSGEYPWETDDLKQIFAETVAASGVVLG